MSSIESVLTETRSFPPPEAFSRDARVKSLADYEALYARALAIFEREGQHENIARARRNHHPAWRRRFATSNPSVSIRMVQVSLRAEKLLE